MKHIPIGSILLTLPTLVIHGLSAQHEFAYDRAVMSHEPWRWISNHWVHWSDSHLFWSAGMFLLLSIACELVNRTQWSVATAASTIAIPLGLFVATPGLRTYGGLSGIDSALVFLLLAQIGANAWRNDETRTLIATAGIAGGFFAKIVYELIADAAFFAGNSGGMFPVPAAHLVGAAIGVAVGLWPHCSRQISSAIMANRSLAHAEGRTP